MWVSVWVNFLCVHVILGSSSRSCLLHMFSFYVFSSSALTYVCLYETCLVSLDSTWAHLYYNEDQQPCNIVRTTAPLSSSPYQRPCVSAMSYRAHTSYSGRCPPTRFEHEPGRGMEGRLVCSCICLCEGEWENRDEERQLWMSVLVFAYIHTHILYTHIYVQFILKDFSPPYPM